MRYLAILLSFLLFSVPSTDKDRYKLGVVNGTARIKPSGTSVWKPISVEHKGMAVQLEDSLDIDKTLFIRESDSRGNIQSYAADKGRWTVGQIVGQKAYNPSRPKEKSADSVKGVETDEVYFDIFVGGEAVTLFHYGDNPFIRVINNNDTPIRFMAFWVEGNGIWNMLDSKESILLDSKSSVIPAPAKNFQVGPPAGVGEVWLIISSNPFTFEDFLLSYNRYSSRFNRLYKSIETCE
ncbi:MAG: hypothetical protein IJR12_06855 [Bacteroidales bacterium]|nr:hypothetical protein [Bacteroidales bacterium]